MSTTSPLSPADSERKPIASVSLKIRLLLIAILLAGVLAVIVPAVADIHGARQELVHQLCHQDARENLSACK